MITEYLRRSVRVEAGNEFEAYNKVLDLISGEDVVLTADDFADREVESLSKFTDGGIDTNDETYGVDDDFSEED
jgi:hypothetical protein